MSLYTYDRMTSDAQIEGLMFGLIMPILRYKWLIDPNGAPDEAVQGIATDLNLDIKNEEPLPRRRRKKRFDFYQHLQDAFLALRYGHYFFEQSGKIIDDPDWPLNGGQRWQLQKLAPREPRTISEINVASDGGLVSIKQNIAADMLGRQPEIPVDNLVAYVWGKEGANWVGRSMLRAIYRDFIVKDKLLRIDVINHERAGGVPVIESQEGATPAEIRDNAKLAMGFRVSADGGGATPHGSKLNLVRAGGTDIINSIRYSDEQMSRRFLLMVMQLGQTQAGARNLGEVFIDFFTLGQQAVAEWFRSTFNEHVIEDWVDWNMGEDVDKVPQLIYEVSDENEQLSIENLVRLIDAQAIVVDEDLEKLLRYRYNLGLKAAGSPAPVPKQKSTTPAPADGAPAPSPNPAGKTTASVRAERGSEDDGSLDSLLVQNPPARNLLGEELTPWLER